MGFLESKIQAYKYYLFEIKNVIIYKETPKKLSLESINPNLRAIQVSMGPNHIAVVATHNLMKNINTQMYIEPIHKVLITLN